MKKTKRRVAAGDVYVRKHPDGRFGAVRVLRVIDQSRLLCTTAYLDSQWPELSDPRLRVAVSQKRFRCRGQAIQWIDGNPSDSFDFVFNLPVSESESKIESSAYGGRWCENTGFETFMEWRWVHDRPALEAEIKADEARSDELRRQAALAQKPKRMMPESQFWNLIALLNWSHEGDDQAVLEPMVQALSLLPKASIRGFAERLAHCLYQIDTRAHAQHIGTSSREGEDSHFSVDSFLYARCVPVANGPVVYAEVLKKPETMPKDIEFEALLSAPEAAWERKTGDDFDYETGCSYETFSNRAGWAEVV